MPQATPPAHAADLRLGRGGRPHRALSRPIPAPRSSARRCLAAAACCASEGAHDVDRSIRSSRSPAPRAPARPPCKHTFEQIFRREGVKAAISRATPSTATTAPACVSDGGGRGRGNGAFQPFRPEANLFAELEAMFRRLWRDAAPASTRHYVHDDAEAEVYGAPPGTFTRVGGRSAEAPTCCSTRACMARVVTEQVNVARHADLKIGVVPVINLEWIQKIHRDKADARLLHRGGDRHHPAPHAGLCPLHLPAIHRRPTSTSSACRWSTRRTRSSPAGSRPRTN